MELDLTQALKDAENSLRDFIASTLEKKFGSGWEEQTGVSEDRLAKWRERKEAEVKRQDAGTVDERLLYYADFYDLKTILKKHWDGDFKDALDEWKTIEVYLNELETLRDPDAHRREMLPHQKHLALGISGDIRTRIVRFRSKQENADSYFPKIECVRDSFGNTWLPGDLSAKLTSTVLRPGDTLEFVITATDPEERSLLYTVLTPGDDLNWQRDNIISIRVNNQHIGKNVYMTVMIKSDRDYHATMHCDASCHFVYDILPAR